MSPRLATQVVQASAPPANAVTSAQLKSLAIAELVEEDALLVSESNLDLLAEDLKQVTELRRMLASQC